MSKGQYGFVLVVALVAGLIGAVVGSRLFPPRVFRALRFEAVDKRGEIRMAFDKSGLTFFPREGETAPVALDAETASLRLYGHNAGDRVEVSAVKRVLRLSDAEREPQTMLDQPRCDFGACAGCPALEKRRNSL